MAQRSYISYIILIALLGGILFRLHPVAVGMPALAETFITEDGYLMLTVARNMAIGLGMSVSDGTIATNGVQPMATFLFAIPYAISGGDKVTSLIGIHVTLTAIAVAGLFTIRAFAARMLEGLRIEPGVLLPWLIASLWFLGPILVRHSMNGLETGLITLMIVATLLQFARVIGRGAEATLADRLVLGFLCGLAFLARIDAAILCAMIFSVWTLDILLRQKGGFGTVIKWLLPPGLLSLAIAAPWLLNNLVQFGSIMPISGTAQSLDVGIGAHAVLIPSKLFEFLFPMLPIPGGLEHDAPVVAILAFIVAVILAIFLHRLFRSGSPVAKAVLGAYLLHAATLMIYYGFFFGAPHFLSRYLAPFAPLLILASVVVATDLGHWFLSKKNGVPALLYGMGGIVLSSLLLVRLLLPGAPDQGHEQVIAWVEKNVPDEVWVGAVQTGTLGYWHDRTINLDGKVNPQALAARREEGHVLNYIVGSEIDYIVDWAGVGNWVHMPEAADGFAEAFDLVLQDEGLDLAVIRRGATGAEAQP